MKPQRVLITGCSSGLGLHAAVGIAASGYEVIATMRNPGKRAALDQALAKRGATAHVLAMDVTDAASVAAAVADVEQRFGGVDVLINNAGITAQGFLENMPDAQFASVFETNVFGVARTTRAFLPLLRRSGQGRVINISSLAGIAGYPGGTVYSTSKWALEGFSESLYYEMLPFGVRVCIVQPGGYATEIYQTNSNHVRGPAGGVYEPMDAALAATYAKVERRNPEQFVEQLIAVLRNPNPPLRTRTSSDAKLAYRLRRVLPLSWFTRLFWKSRWKRMAELGRL